MTPPEPLNRKGLPIFPRGSANEELVRRDDSPFPLKRSPNGKRMRRGVTASTSPPLSDDREKTVGVPFWSRGGAAPDCIAGVVLTGGFFFLPWAFGLPALHCDLFPDPRTAEAMLLRPIFPSLLPWPFFSSLQGGFRWGRDFY